MTKRIGNLGRTKKAWIRGAIALSIVATGFVTLATPVAAHDHEPVSVQTPVASASAEAVHTRDGTCHYERVSYGIGGVANGSQLILLTPTGCPLP